MRPALLLLLSVCGCGSDLFALPYDSALDGGGVSSDLAGGDGSGGDLLPGFEGGIVDLAGVDLTPGALPASCAQIGCTPATNEGEVDLAGGEVSGCHAYQRLTISGVVTVGTQGLVACAEHIVLGISLSADGRGFDGAGGPGGGGSCGSGGGHGGKGGDATGCSGGGTYDDPSTPRMAGSGGGSFGGGGGAGGGVIELAADDIEIIGFITANGQEGAGAVAGGGSGGSVLIHAGQLVGTGQVRAQGGDGFGLGGGGGGGRVAVYATSNTSAISYNVNGGDSMMSGSQGADGSLVQP